MTTTFTTIPATGGTAMGERTRQRVLPRTVPTPILGLLPDDVIALLATVAPAPLLGTVFRDEDVAMISTDDPATAILDLAENLGLSTETVCNAVGVSPRTFKNWRKTGAKPQLRSLGRLWNVVLVVNQLAAGRSNLMVWIHASRDRLRHFQAGDMNALVREHILEASAGAPLVPPYAPTDSTPAPEDHDPVTFVQKLVTKQSRNA